MKRGVAEASPGLPLALPAPGDAPSAPPFGAEGHRKRLRARLLDSGRAALADHELLELVLFLAIPRRDTKPIAKKLLAEFQDFAGIVAAAPADLQRIDGLGEAGIAALKIIDAAALRLLEPKRGDPGLLLNNYERLKAYLHAELARENQEQFRVLYLDNRNRLIVNECQWRGTVNNAPVYPREVCRRGVALHATAMILIHNHPSGDVSPSADDIAMTKDVATAGGVMGIAVHDHIIVGNKDWFSFRQHGLL